MRLTKPLIYFSLFLLIPAALPGPAQAKKDKYKMKYSRMDRNQDGIVTLGEWRGGDNVFHGSDWNGDGVLSGNEVTGGFLRANDYDRNHSEELFRDLDKNKDGIVSLKEWDGLLEAFNRLDDNRDGGLVPKEFVNRIVEGTDRFTALDLDRDGYISRAEWLGDTVRFKAVDKNDDGRLSRKEFPQTLSLESRRDSRSGSN